MVVLLTVISVYCLAKISANFVLSFVVKRFELLSGVYSKDFIHNLTRKRTAWFPVIAFVVTVDGPRILFYCLVTVICDSFLLSCVVVGCRHDSDLLLVCALCIVFCGGQCEKVMRCTTCEIFAGGSEQNCHFLRAHSVQFYS